MLFIPAMPKSAIAQMDYIVEAMEMPAVNAIVRHWYDEYYIVYCDNGVDSSHFCCVNLSSMSYLDFCTGYLGVKDFEIAKDMVYFCGKNVTSPNFGYFDIPLLFYGGGTSVTTVNLGGSYSSVGYPGYTEQVLDLFELEVQLCNDGVHVYMIGASEFSGQPDTTRCIVDMRNLSGSSTWLCQMAQEQYSVYYYDDITLTDNYVVVVGNKHGGEGQYNSSYVKPTSAANQLIPAPCLALYTCAGDFDDYTLFRDKPLMVEHLLGDYYATVGHASIDLGPNVDGGTVISIYEAANNTCIYRRFLPQGYADTAYWKLLDFRYNETFKRLYLLQRMSNPISNVVESVICAFDISSGPWSITATKVFWIPEQGYMSLDQCSSVGEAIVAGGKDTLHLWRPEQGGDCVKEEKPTLDPVLESFYERGYYQWPITWDLSVGYEFGSVEKRKMKYLCK